MAKWFFLNNLKVKFDIFLRFNKIIVWKEKEKHCTIYYKLETSLLPSLVKISMIAFYLNFQFIKRTPDVDTSGQIWRVIYCKIIRRKEILFVETKTTQNIWNF